MRATKSMKRWWCRKTLAIIICITFLINITGCCLENEQKNNSTNQVKNVFIEDRQIADNITLDIGEQNKIIADKLFYETELRDDFVYETVVADEIIADSIVLEICVDTYDEDAYWELIPESVRCYNIDWESVISKFAIGATITIVVGTLTILSTGTTVAYVLAQTFVNVVKEELVGAAIGALTNVLLNGRASQEDTVKYIVEGAADGFMWGAVTGAVMGPFLANQKQALETPLTLIDENDEAIGFIDDFDDIVNQYNEYLGYVLRSDQYAYYLDDSGRILGSLDSVSDASGLTDDVIRLSKKVDDTVPANLSKVKKNGRYSSNFGISGDDVISGNKVIGKLDRTTGAIISPDGQLLGQIDSRGYLIVNNFRASKSGFRFDSAGRITNKYRLVNNSNALLGATKTVEYMDDTGRVIGYGATRIGSDGVERTFLMSSDNSVVGILNNHTHISKNWNLQMSNLSAKGVNDAKETIVKMIQNDVAFDYGPSFTDDVIRYIKQTGKLPEGLLQGHHINNVASTPWLADNMDNIVFYNNADHLMIGHNGNFQNSSFGKLTGISKYK